VTTWTNRVYRRTNGSKPVVQITVLPSVYRSASLFPNLLQ